MCSFTMHRESAHPPDNTGKKAGSFTEASNTVFRSSGTADTAAAAWSSFSPNVLNDAIRNARHTCFRCVLHVSDASACSVVKCGKVR
jgi:hypothetical protein